ncbi:MAG: DUF3800 domain-containing protein [Candidatus Brocadia sp.]|nr:DUF3800 domain-containing protein [Candidatus Brocadia sp.]
MFIYLDESGDLGFDFSKKKTTKKFVITLLVCNSDMARKEFTKAVRRTLKNKLNQKKKNSRQITELKGINTTLEIKRYFFRKYENNDMEWYKVYGDKVRFETEYLR